jgi:hypothetical protein
VQWGIGEDRRRGRGIGVPGREGGPREIKKRETGGSHNELVGIKLKFEGR